MTTTHDPGNGTRRPRRLKARSIPVTVPALADARAALYKARRRPVASTAAAAGVASAVISALAGAGGQGVLLALLIGGGSGAVLAAAVRARIAYGRNARHLQFPRARPARTRMFGEKNYPEPPSDLAAALKTVDGILAYLKPAPEKVHAADPATVRVLWDPDPAAISTRPGVLPGHRADKMRQLAGLVRTEAMNRGIMHQLPSAIILVADDGAVIELSGSLGFGRTGAVSGL